MCCINARTYTLHVQPKNDQNNPTKISMAGSHWQIMAHMHGTPLRIFPIPDGDGRFLDQRRLRHKRIFHVLSTLGQSKKESVTISSLLAFTTQQIATNLFHCSSLVNALRVGNMIHQGISSPSAHVYIQRRLYGAVCNPRGYPLLRHTPSLSPLDQRCGDNKGTS
jgi:hypothetical protein